jgi:hypothetical protein
VIRSCSAVRKAWFPVYRISKSVVLTLADWSLSPTCASLSGWAVGWARAGENEKQRQARAIQRMIIGGRKGEDRVCKITVQFIDPFSSTLIGSLNLCELYLMLRENVYFYLLRYPHMFHSDVSFDSRLAMLIPSCGSCPHFALQGCISPARCRTIGP